MENRTLIVWQSSVLCLSSDRCFCYFVSLEWKVTWREHASVEMEIMNVCSWEWRCAKNRNKWCNNLRLFCDDHFWFSRFSLLVRFSFSPLFLWRGGNLNGAEAKKLYLFISNSFHGMAFLPVFLRSLLLCCTPWDLLCIWTTSFESNMCCIYHLRGSWNSFIFSVLNVPYHALTCNISVDCSILKLLSPVKSLFCVELPNKRNKVSINPS